MVESLNDGPTLPAELNAAGIVDAISENLRQEPYNLLTNDCLTKSFRLKKLPDPSAFG